MQTLKIEYTNGVLVAVEYNGKSYMDLPLSALHFRHEKSHNPYFKVEVEEGGELHQPLPVSDTVECTTRIDAESVKEGELIPAEQTRSMSGPRKHRRNRNHNRSNHNVQA